MPVSAATTWCRCRGPGRPSRCSCAVAGCATTFAKLHRSSTPGREESRPAFVPCDPLTGARLDPERPPHDRRLPTRQRARGAGPRPRRSVPLPRLLAWPPGSATSTTCGPGRSGPPQHATCSPCADATTASSSDPAGGFAWPPTAPPPGPTRPVGMRTTAPLNALETLVLVSEPSDNGATPARARHRCPDHTQRPSLSCRARSANASPRLIRPITERWPVERPPSVERARDRTSASASSTTLTSAPNSTAWSHTSHRRCTSAADLRDGFARRRARRPGARPASLLSARARPITRATGADPRHEPVRAPPTGLGWELCVEREEAHGIRKGGAPCGRSGRARSPSGW